MKFVIRAALPLLVSSALFGQCGATVPNVSSGFFFMDCIGTGGAPAFSAVTPGTNTGALVIGSGGSLGVSGSGTINATALGGATFAAPGAIGGGTPGSGSFTTIVASGNITGGAATNLDCSGCASVSLPAPWVDIANSHTYTAGKKQTFVSSATTAGRNDTGVADPSALVGGDQWVSLTGFPKWSTNGTITLGSVGNLVGQDITLLSTGLMKVTTTTGAITAVVAGSGVETWITTPSSANLAAAVTGETGSGALVFGTAPTINGLTFPTAGGGAVVTQTIASGAKALATSAISSAACSSAQTDTATGTATTDAIIATFNADPVAVTGYVPLTAGGLTIYAYPTTNTVNFKICNFTSSSITPGAITLNWRVVR